MKLWLLKYRLLHLLIAVLLIAISYSGPFNKPWQSPEQAADVLKKSIQRFIDHSDTLLPKLVNNCHLIYPYNCPELNAQNSDNDITALRYENETLVYWNSNSITPRLSQLPEPGTVSVKNFKNGYYLCKGLRKDSLSVYVLQPIYLDYNTTNSYLKDHFTPSFAISNNYKPHLQPQPESIRISFGDGSVSIYLTKVSSQPEDWQCILLFILLLIGLILLVQFLLFVLTLIKQKFSFIQPALLYLLLAIGIHLFFFLFFEAPESLRGLLIFNPNYYASPHVADSLGTLLTEGILLFIIAANYFTLESVSITSDTGKYFLIIIHTLLISAASFALVYIYKSLILDSNISFEFFNPYNPDFNNLINLAAVGILVFSHLVVCHRLYKDIRNNRVPYIHFWVVFILLLSSTFWWFILTSPREIALILALSILPTISVADTKRFGGYLNDVSGIFIMLIAYSLLISYLVYNLSVQKDLDLRKAFASKLITERDNVTEYLLGEIRSNVLNDVLLQKYFASNNIKQQEVIEHLNRQYFDDGFNRFNTKYYFYDKDNKPISVIEDEPTVSNNELISNSEVCGEHELYFLTEPAGSFTYIAEYPIKKDQEQIGTLMVQLTSKLYKSANVYPELLLEEKNKLPVSDYSYGIYTGGYLSEHSGEYNYPYHNTINVDSLSDGEMIQTISNGFNHLVYKRDMNKTVIISLEEDQTARLLSYFTYLFIVLIFWAVIVWLYFNLRPVLHSDVSTFSYSTVSFRAFIQVAFFIIILSSVLLIGFYTGRFFIQQFNKQSEQKLFEKLEQVAALSNFIIYDKLGSQKIDFGYYTLTDLMRNNITSISSIQKIDINIYNLNGDLLTTSQPAIFEKGFISRKINPNAYSLLTHNVQNQLIQRERIGELNFLSGYKPIILKNGELAAFIHLPYFNSTKYLNEQLGVFFATLISILVFALIAAGLLAPLISKHIARRLDVIAEKFKQVTLGKKNEPIEWHTKDEIGSLVEEFNKMILKLEQNAMLLAKSERESAWREMAKQVAHEIKNPLTPMKLSIQHLQRAYQNNAPNKEELARKVSNTLIEQIDNLTRIANEFSTFAKMPVSEMERINLTDVLRASYNLYKENESATFSYEAPEHEIFVLADKNELLRVFNNLMLNAIQAIPENKPGKVSVTVKESATSVAVHISDNGIGIKEEEAARLFTPNFTTKNSGTGLGLAISKNIIEGFGGKIYFRSEHGNGTTFTVELPKVR